MYMRLYKCVVCARTCIMRKYLCVHVYECAFACVGRCERVRVRAIHGVCMVLQIYVHELMTRTFITKNMIEEE